MPLQPWRTGKVIRIEQQTETTRRFFIQIPELDVFDFKAGQFVTLDLPIHEKPARRLRSYSIASWPDDSNVFELCIVLLEGGAGTTYLFNEITEGSELILRGPVGVFTLHEPIEKDLYFICTGTGIAPFRSMLFDIKRKGTEYRSMYLLFGCRFKKDILYFEELKALADSMPNVHYLPTLSREDWEGPQGYVHPLYQAIIRDKQQQDAEQNLPESQFFLCGWKNMIDEAKEKIMALGYDKRSIHQELYG